MEKSGLPMDHSLDYAEGRNATPSAPPAYDEAMASAYKVHNNMHYEQSLPLNAAPPQHAVNANYPPAGTYPQQHHITVAQPAPVPCILPVGPKPLKTECPTCHKHITSRINTKNSTFCKFILCIVLCATVVCIPCSCIPFCCCGPERVSHFCPGCNAHLGTWERQQNKAAYGFNVNSTGPWTHDTILLVVGRS